MEGFEAALSPCECMYGRSSRNRSPRKFGKVVVTRDARLREWSQGKLRLYMVKYGH